MEEVDSLEILDKMESQPELPEIRIFQAVRRNFEFLGICPALLDQPYLFNCRILLGCLIFGSGLISVFISLIFEANTFWEFTQTAFFGSVLVSGILALLFLVFRVPRLFKLFANFEHVIDTSE